MSAKESQPDFDEEFLQAIKQWRERYKVQDNDAVFLLMELFRIHQKHWDELRRRQMPSLDQFRTDVTAVTESAKSFREKLEDLIEALATHPAAVPVKTIPLPEAIYAAAAALLGGLFIGSILGKFLL
jgi:hypothetical protein